MLSVIGKLTSARASQLLCLGVAVILMPICCKGDRSCCDLLRSTAQVDTGIHFYYFEGAAVQEPVMFLAVNNNDPRINTAAWNQQGRIVYISVDEASSILHVLDDLHIRWNKLPGTNKFADVQSLLHVDRMTITVITAQGSLEGGINPQSVCSVLASMDSAFRSRRALWEFQMFTAEYNCRVPGLQRDLYKDR